MSLFSGIFGGPETATEDQIKELLKGDALIIDVRTEREFVQGHITGAINIPVHAIMQFTNDIKKHNKKVVLYCLSGARASSALRVLQGAGIEAYNGGAIHTMSRLVG